MSQGLKISELPALDKNQIQGGDLLIVAEKVKEGSYRTRKLDASYLLKLKTEADNAGNDTGRFEIFKNTTTNTTTQASILNFRGLKAGNDIKMTQSDDNITIEAVVNGENIANAANDVGIYQGKNNTNGNLKFKSIAGEKGIETRFDTNKVYVKPRDHHYFFIPAVPTNPSTNPSIVNIKSKKKNESGALWPNRPLSGEWNTGAQIVDLTSRINALPQAVKNSLNLAEKGLALVRIKVNTNSGGNVGHFLDVLDTANDWQNKVAIDPTGGSGTAWEGEDTFTTTIEFNKSTGRFSWRIRVGSASRTNVWEFNVTMHLEGFYA
jgi:hypothetical protein